MTTEEQNANPTPTPETSATPPPETPTAKPAAPTAVSPTPAAAAPAVPERPAKPAVAIGSQRDHADKSLSPSAPKAVQAAVANPIKLSGQPVDEIKVEEVHINSCLLYTSPSPRD